MYSALSFPVLAARWMRRRREGRNLGNRVVSQELMDLGSRIKEHRREAGVSQEALAEKAGISPNTVSRIEGGLMAMSVETFQKLVQALGMDANELICHAGLSEGGDRHIRDIFDRISRMEQREREIVVQTVRSLVEALEKSR